MKHIHISLLTLLITYTFSAQERSKDSIDNQTVNVITPYKPVISDAFKIRTTPNALDSATVNKKQVLYNIFSIPVASTFTPAKGKAATLDKEKQPKLFNNYASLGLGNYTNILGDVYINHKLDKNSFVGGYLGHHSSQGGIDEVLLDDDFSVTTLNAYYKQMFRDYSWQAEAGAKLQSFNWYGLPLDVYTTDQINSIDPSHNFTSLFVKGNVDFSDATVSNVSVNFNRFTDNYDAAENRFTLDSKFKIPVRRDEIYANLTLDYLTGTYADLVNLDYSNFIIGIAPYYSYNQDELSVKFGLKLAYFNDSEQSESKFFIYPNIEASYNLIDEILIPYGGLKGGLIQNTYESFVEHNPFVSPNLLISPTDQTYRGYIGIKGRLSNNVSYNLKGNYTTEDNKPLFKSNTAVVAPTQNYEYGNSFGVVYDKVTTISVAGELNLNVSDNFTLGIKGEYFNYSTDNEAEAWNLPDFESSVFVDYQISKKWYTGGSIFFVGQRKDQLLPADTIVSIDSFVDANAYLGYRWNDRWTFFSKVNNIASNSYDRFVNFPVQGLQLLVGATYKFDL